MQNVGSGAGGTRHLGRASGERSVEDQTQWLRPLLSAVVVVHSCPTLLQPQGVQIAFLEVYQHTSDVMQI